MPTKDCTEIGRQAAQVEKIFPELFLKHKVNCSDQQYKANKVTPLKRLFQVKDRKEGKYHQRDHFLRDL